jgi:hypothetical protein
LATVATPDAVRKRLREYLPELDITEGRGACLGNNDGFSLKEGSLSGKRGSLWMVSSHPKCAGTTGTVADARRVKSWT